MIKKSKSKFKSCVHEHLGQFLKSTYAQRLLWLSKANKMTRQLRRAVNIGS